MESELSKLVTSVETDFDWHGRPHFPVRIGLPASMHQVRILQFDTVPALSCELPEDENEVGASYVDWSELLERCEQLYFQLQGQEGANKPLEVRRLLGVLYRYWAQKAEREVADRTRSKLTRPGVRGLLPNHASPRLSSVFQCTSVSPQSRRVLRG